MRKKKEFNIWFVVCILLVLCFLVYINVQSQKSQPPEQVNSVPIDLSKNQVVVVNISIEDTFNNPIHCYYREGDFSVVKNGTLSVWQNPHYFEKESVTSENGLYSYDLTYPIPKIMEDIPDGRYTRCNYFVDVVKHVTKIVGNNSVSYSERCLVYSESEYTHFQQNHQDLLNCIKRVQ